MKIALVHDWLIHMRGGEKVLEALAEIYPDAEIYTLFYRRAKLSPLLRQRKIHASFLQILPGISRYYRWFLPVLPWVIQSLKIRGADCVISTSHCVAKGIGIPKGALHICYCHTPMRYVWGFEKTYFRKWPWVIRPLLNFILARIRDWDVRSNRTVDFFVSNSANVSDRIRRFYNREAEIIYPPVDLDFYRPVGVPKQYYLSVSAFVPYKRMDVVIEAFNDLDRTLLLVGAGPLEREYQRLRRSGKIFFLKNVPDEELRKLYSEARALIFPAEEDFGIVPVEAQGCGTPVIAFGKGGARETVKLGILFAQQSAEALCRAIQEFEEKSFDREAVRASVAGFNKQRFKDQMMECVASHLPGLAHASA